VPAQRNLRKRQHRHRDHLGRNTPLRRKERTPSPHRQHT
jgi:hypothetical protein